MIVAIIKKGAGTGQTKIEEFRVAASTAAALTAFVTDYNPAKNEADYVAFDTGETDGHPRATAGKQWGYDHDTPGMVELTITDAERAPGSAPDKQFMQSADGNVWERTLSNVGVLSAWTKVR
ncbi:hypothetical protein LCGC14_1271210 [marine sediment metagenome]|uniref:Uncharacterized protein n=1 Tax=marine sediment metagenome TaxID=412755 RepID=A0A0F9KZU5_9ZZZZ